jgi:hypothetical protein
MKYRLCTVYLQTEKISYFDFIQTVLNRQAASTMNAPYRIQIYADCQRSDGTSSKFNDKGANKKFIYYLYALYR